MRGAKEHIRQHWSKTKQFDRLLWGSVTESIISIDSFRALDTTRILDRWGQRVRRLLASVYEARAEQRVRRCDSEL